MPRCKPQEGGNHGVTTWGTMAAWDANHMETKGGNDRVTTEVETTQEGGNHVKMQTMGGWKPWSNHMGWKPWQGGNRVTTEWKPREGGNDRVTTKVETMGGWKPQRVETTGGWKPWEGGNHKRVETMGRWKPRQGGNHGRVETTPGLKPQRHQTLATEITLKGKGYKK